MPNPDFFIVTHLLIIRKCKNSKIFDYAQIIYGYYVHHHVIYAMFYWLANR